jgi:predicted double-glycine peptidase
MTKIGGPLRPARAQTPKDVAPAEAPRAAATVARVAGFSNLSSFNAPGAAGRASEPFGRAPSGAVKLSPNDLGVLAQNQGNTNACGTTSLANVMTHWGMPRTHEQIDQSIRPFDLFTAPDKLVEYARASGMRADIKADATLDDLTRMIDQGVPPIVLMDPDSDKNANLHYVTVTGYNRDAHGNISELVIADSAGGHRYTMSAEEFQQKWDNLKLGGIGTGLNNVMITAIPNDGRMITGGDGVQRRASDIQLPRTSFWSNLKSGFARGVANLIANAASFGQSAWNGVKAVGSAIGNAAEAIGNTAKKLWKSIFG